MSESVVIRRRDVKQPEQHIRDLWGAVDLTSHYSSMDRLTLWFIGKPDKDYQNYIVQMGDGALVISKPPDGYKKTNVGSYGSFNDF